MSDSKTKINAQLSKLNNGYKIKIRQREKQDGSFSLYLDYVNTGRRQKHTLELFVFGDSKHKIKDDNEILKARLFRDKKERELYTSSTGIIFNEELSEEDDFLEFFHNQYTSRTDYNYKVSYNNFIDFKKVDHLPFKDLTRDICKGYRDYLNNLNVKAHTAHHYFVAFKAVLEQALIEGKIESNPARGIKIKYDEPEMEFLFIEEVKKLIETSYKHIQVKNGFLFSCFTGLRLSDLNRITFGDVRNVTENGTENKFLFFRQKKTSTTVRIKLNKIALEILAEQSKIMKTDNVFRIPTGGRLSVRLKALLNCANITRSVTFHCSRHTFGTLLALKGENVYTISRLMGHKNIKTTMRYLHIAESMQDSAINKLDEYFE